MTGGAGIGSGATGAGAVDGATGGTGIGSGAGGVGAVGGASGGGGIGGGGVDAQLPTTGTAIDPATVRSASSGPNVQGGVPSVSVEADASQAAGQDGGVVLRGGGAGLVEGQTGELSGAGVETEATAAARQGNVEARGAAGVAGGATSFRDPSAEVARAENLEFHQRDQAVAKAHAAEDAHDQARRIADDPSAVGTERAEAAASQRIGDAMPAGAARAEANVNLATTAVANPRAAAQGQAEAEVSAQQRDTEVKLGIRGSAGASREEVTGSPSIDDKKK